MPTNDRTINNNTIDNNNNNNNNNNKVHTDREVTAIDQI
jgi:hypothetical protein